MVPCLQNGILAVLQLVFLSENAYFVSDDVPVEMDGLAFWF